MKFSDFVCEQAVIPQVQAKDKLGVIREMVQSLLDNGLFPASELEGIVKAVMKREDLGSTGIGRGVAVPHTKHASVSKLVGTVAVCSEGIEFESLDGEQVQLLFLLISPPDRPGDHLRALENISRQLRDDVFCKALKSAVTTQEILKLLQAADQHQPVH